MILLWPLIRAAWGEPLCEQTPRSPLVVVLWERRVPKIEGESLDFATRQSEMAESLAGRLLGSEHCDPLVAPGAAVSVLGEGFESSDAAIQRGVLSARSPALVYELLADGLPDTADPVRPVHLTLSTADALKDAIRDNIITPMAVGGEHARRGVSHPWMLTHHALAEAFSAHDLDDSCSAPSEVYLIWVSAGRRGYQITEIIGRIREDFDYRREGGRGVAHYAALESLYTLDRLDCRQSDPLLTTQRVRLRHTPPSIPTWTDPDGNPAALDYTARRLRYFQFPFLGRRIESVSLPVWHLPRLDSGTLHSVTARLGDQPVDLSLSDGTIQIGSPDKLTRQLLTGRLTTLGERGGTYAPALHTALWYAPDDNLPAGFPASPRISILEALSAPPPQIALTYDPFGLLTRLLIAGLMLFSGLAVFLAIWKWTRVRPLRVELRTADEPVDLSRFRESGSFEVPLSLRVTDASGHTPRWSALLTIEATLSSYLQPDVPLKPDFHKEAFQSLRSDAWSIDGPTATVTIGPPRPDALHQRALSLLTHHAGIDHARVVREDMEVVVGLSIRVTERRGLYETFEESRFCQIRLRSVAGPPRPRWAFSLLQSIGGRHLQLALTGAARMSTEEWRINQLTQIGHIELYNQPPATYRTLPVCYTLASAVATYTPNDGSAPLSGRVLVCQDEQPETSWTAHSQADPLCRGVWLEIPEVIYGHTVQVWTVTVNLQLAATVPGFSGEIPPLPPVIRQFRFLTGGPQRLLCLDFGTSTTRMLLQDIPRLDWGYLPLDSGDPQEAVDLGSAVFIDTTHQVWLGTAAEVERTVRKGRYLDSIKSVMLQNPRDMGILLQTVLHTLLDQKLKPTTETVKKTVTAWQLTASGANEMVLRSGPRDHFVVMLPNDAALSYERALRSAVLSYPDFQGTLTMLREAEAVALWRGATLFKDPPPVLDKRIPDPLNVLILDCGAGTSDSALVQVHRPPTESSVSQLHQKTRILSTGGARCGGRDLEVGLFNALSRLSDHGIRWSDLSEDERVEARQTMERIKLEKLTGKQEIVARFEVGGEVLPPFRTSPKKLRAEKAYTDVLRRMIHEPLAALVGRRGPGEDLSDVHLIAVTGRASQAAGFIEILGDEIHRYGAPRSIIHQPPTHYLKAAVTLGARLFAQGLCGDFVPSDRSFRDRILLIYRHHERGAESVELLRAGCPYDGGEIIGEWCEVPYFEEGVLVRTWLQPHAAPASHPWHLDRAGMARVLLGEPLEGVSAVQPYQTLETDFDSIQFSGTGHGRRVQLRVRVQPDEAVQLEHRGHA